NQCIGDCSHTAFVASPGPPNVDPDILKYGDKYNAWIVKHLGPPATAIAGFTGMNPAYCGMNSEPETPEDTEHPKEQTEADKKINNMKEVKGPSPKRPGPAPTRNRNGSVYVERVGSFAEVPGLINNGLRCISNSSAPQH